MPIKPRKNVHQTHMESLILLGPDGIEELNDKIESMVDFLEDNEPRLNQTVKIDGSPALYCWSRYEGYPDNSIALKSFVKGPETAMSSTKDIEQKYPSEDRTNMREMLKYGLEIAKHIPKGECWQGDCLFTKDSKREEEIDGTKYITFQPNKIIYAFSEDNPGFNQIKNADFGICFHTIYTGQDKRQSFNVDVSRLDLPSNIYVMSPALNVNRSKFNLGKIKTSFSRLEQLESDLLQTSDYEELVNNIAFMDYWNRFENASLADKKQTTIDTKTFLSDLVEFVEDKKSAEFEKKFASLKTEKGREKARSKYESELEELKQLIESNKSLLVKIVQTFNEAAKIKMFLWEGYKQSQMDYNTYYKSKTKGYIKGDMEGVAMSDQNGNIVKIVDRSAFSSYNRDPDIESGWEHNESLDEDLNSDFYNIDDIAKEYSISPDIIKQFILAVHKMPGKEIEDKDLEDWDCDESLDEELASFDIYEEYSNYNEDALKKKFDNLLESIEEPLVVAFGRMNPITKGHQKLVDTMASLARGNKARLYLSHTQDKKKNPLSYEQKIKWAKEAFEPKIDVVESNARTLIEVLADLYKEGFKNIVYVGGEDRIGGTEDVSDLILRYNGQPDKQGNILYDFDSIQFKSAGSRDDESSDFTERASASLARKYAQEGDFESFKEIVPVENAEELYKEVRAGLGLQESLNEAEEKTFTKKRDFVSKGVNSFAMAYDMLLKDLKATKGVNDALIAQVSSAIENIERITNSINIETLNSLSQRLTSSNSGVSPSQFITLFNPTEKDLTKFLANHQLKSSIDLNKFKFSENFLTSLINYRGGDKKSTTAIGPYEFLIAVLFEGGSTQVINGKAGDVSVSGKDIEVKNIKNPAAIGYDIGDAAELTNAFDDFVFSFEDKNRAAKTRATIRSSSFENKEFKRSELPDILQKIVSSNVIKFSDLYNLVFKTLIDMYATRFDLLALCKGANIRILDAKNNLAETLISNYKITFADYVGKRVFKIQG